MIIGMKENHENNQLTTKRYIYHDSIDFVFDEYDMYMIVRYDCYNYNQMGLTNEHSDETSNDYVTNIVM